MHPPETYIEGQFLLIDKPLTWTSHDVVNKIRYRLTRYCRVKKLKVGHGGTLDPLATGLLLIATGKNTKMLQDLIDANKEYTGTLKLGATTASYDGETPEENIQSITHITENMIRAAFDKFTGDIQQKPPAHSAIKKDGEPMYIKAREGTAPEMEARSVRIIELEITQLVLPEIHFRVACSKGTYIRSLAHDIGQELGCGAWLSSLVRTRIGQFHIQDALQLDDYLKTVELPQ